MPFDRDIAVLVVDDEAVSRRVLGCQLSALGYRVLTAGDGAEALATLQTLTVDLVLLDVHMPRLSGVDVLTTMQRDPALRWVPVIMVSANGETADITRCLTLGAEDYTVKPFNPVVLDARIGAALARKQARDAERSAFASLQDQQTRVERLLHQVLPPSIARRLADGEEQLTDTIPAATVLFADLANFTGLSRNYPPAASCACSTACSAPSTCSPSRPAPRRSRPRATPTWSPPACSPLTPTTLR